MDLVARFSENMSAKCSAMGKGTIGWDRGSEMVMEALLRAQDEGVKEGKMKAVKLNVSVDSACDVCFEAHKLPEVERVTMVA